MKKPKILCVIPARLGSTRLPNKPLIILADNKPMVQLTYEKAVQCKDVDKVIVATDSEEVAKVIRSCGGTAEITDAAIKTGTDRVAVIAQRYSDYDVIINLQGDEPFIKPEMLSTLVKPYLDGENPDMSTIASPIKSDEEYHDPGAVKVLFDQNKYALYFSRSPIPYFRQTIAGLQIPVLHHIGVYAFRRDFLLKYTTMSQTPLELTESLEQLRALENGYKIKVCRVEGKTLEINTPEDLQKIIND